MELLETEVLPTVRTLPRINKHTQVSEYLVNTFSSVFCWLQYIRTTAKIWRGLLKEKLQQINQGTVTNIRLLIQYQCQ